MLSSRISTGRRLNGQRRLFQRQQQKNQAAGSGCGQQKLQPFVKYGTEFLVQSRVNKPFMRFRQVKQVLQRSVCIGKLFRPKGRRLTGESR